MDGDLIRIQTVQNGHDHIYAIGRILLQTIVTVLPWLLNYLCYVDGSVMSSAKKMHLSSHNIQHILIGKKPCEFWYVHSQSCCMAMYQIQFSLTSHLVPQTEKRWVTRRECGEYRSPCSVSATTYLSCLRPQVFWFNSWFQMGSCTEVICLGSKISHLVCNAAEFLRCLTAFLWWSILLGSWLSMAEEAASTTSTCISLLI